MSKPQQVAKIVLERRAIKAELDRIFPGHTLPPCFATKYPTPYRLINGGRGDPPLDPAGMRGKAK